MVLTVGRFRFLSVDRVFVPAVASSCLYRFVAVLYWFVVVYGSSFVVRLIVRWCAFVVCVCFVNVSFLVRVALSVRGSLLVLVVFLWF